MLNGHDHGHEMYLKYLHLDHNEHQIKVKDLAFQDKTQRNLTLKKPMDNRHESFFFVFCETLINKQVSLRKCALRKP